MCLRLPDPALESEGLSWQACMPLCTLAQELVLSLIATTVGIASYPVGSQQEKAVHTLRDEAAVLRHTDACCMSWVQRVALPGSLRPAAVLAQRVAHRRNRLRICHHEALLTPKGLGRGMRDQPVTMPQRRWSMPMAHCRLPLS